MKTRLAGFVGSLSLLVPGAALAADAQLMAPIHQFIDSFNKGDVKGAAAANLATGVSIIDEFPPHFWQGPKAFATWVDDLTKNDKAAGITEEKVTLGAVTREVLSGDTAYVVTAATYSFKQKGVAMTEPAQMTFALKKAGDAWKISAWTWTGPDPTPAK